MQMRHVTVIFVIPRGMLPWFDFRPIRIRALASPTPARSTVPTGPRSRRCMTLCDLIEATISLMKTQGDPRSASPCSASLRVFPCDASISWAEQKYFPTTMEIERKVPLAVTDSQSANILERKRIAQCLFLPRLCPSAFYKFLIDRDPHRLSMTRSSDCMSEMRKRTTNCSPRSVNSRSLQP
jgi:hypothetical protein